MMLPGSPDQPMAAAVYHWIIAKALLIVIGINFAAFACAIALAIHAVIMARRVAQLARAVEQNAIGNDGVMQAHDRPLQTVASLPASDLRDKVDSLEKEISSLRSEICSRRQPEIAAATANSASHLELQRAREDIERLRTEFADETGSRPAAADEG
jgi:hypothetical protein